MAHSSWWMIVYALVGPGAWLAFGLAMIFARARMGRLRRPIPPLAVSQSPSVTVLIPAKDEGEGVRASLGRVLALDYPDVRVIAIDDRSSDQTGAIMDEIASKHPTRLQVIHIPPGGLPAGWLGKCNALHAAAANVTSAWILFIDADVKVEPDSLSAVLALAVGREYDAVSIMTRLECEGFWEELILPLTAASVGAITLMSMTNEDKRKHIAFANGQFFLIRRAAYERVGGHAAVRDNITEDVALMRLLKKNDFRVRLYYGRDFASTRMHTTWRQLFNGWARIFSGVTNRKPWRILAAMAFVGVSGLSAHAVVIAAALARDQRLFVLAALHLFLMTTILAAVYRMSGNRARFALLYPLAAGVLIALYAYAVRACVTGKIAWRGTSYTAGSATSPNA
jgi:cellulose synthase/poly-beta-1,6-N-acetylglucosamine synthase-like glycosyltransferase